MTVTRDFLARRAYKSTSRGYPKQKWIIFCEELLDKGFTLTMYEARRTVSKYVTVHREGFAPFKVRFSNHKPIRHREAAGDCDFFVGITHFGTTTTDDALAAVYKHFKISLYEFYRRRKEDTTCTIALTLNPA